MAKKYHRLDELIEMIEEPNRNSCRKIYSENKVLFEKAKGSNVKHQAWEGGYLDHLTEAMNIAVILYDSLNCCRPLPFSLSDGLLVLYLHDLEKPWKYAGDQKQRLELESFPHCEDFIRKKIDEYKFQLSEEHWNGLKYVHGEGEDYDPKTRVQGSLAAFVHICDNISARIWFDFPREGDFLP